MIEKILFFVIFLFYGFLGQALACVSPLSVAEENNYYIQAFDKNKDGVLTFDEFSTFNSSEVVTDEDRKLIRKNFDTHDVNKDGKIEHDEGKEEKGFFVRIYDYIIELMPHVKSQYAGYDGTKCL